MEKVIVSACLIGENCKYNGGNNKREKIIEYLKDKEVILVCPEVMGGMSTPRLKSEILNGRVVSEKGDDVTDYFTRGAIRALNKAIESGAKVAILKEKSPSCGSKYIYNGEFNGTLIKGSGVFASLIRQKGIKILTEEDFMEE